MTANVRTMAYIGKTPWHGLGNRLSAGASIDVWKREAGMDYELLKTAPTFDFNGQTITVDDKAVIYRSDDGTPISIMSKAYKVVQPGEVLEFFRDLTDDMDYELETAGVLGDGAKYWALAKTGRSADIGNSGDTLDDYVLLATSSDGSMATRALRTSIRVVCQNTLSFALADKQAGVRVSHRTTFDPTNVKERMGLIDATAWTDFVAEIDKLVATPVKSAEAARDFYLAVNDIDLTAGDELTKRQVNRLRGDLQQFASNLQRAPGQRLESADRTLWGLVNAITYETDHQARARSNGNRLSSAWFGEGDKRKNRAFDLALSMAEGADVVEASRVILADGREEIEQQFELAPPAAMSYVDQILAGMTERGAA